jgi:hypothetical protein
MKNLYKFLIFLLPFNCLSQFKIITDGTYEPKLRTAINLIRETDAGYYCLFVDYCTQIRISSDSIPKQFNDGVMNVPLRLVSSPSLNNLSSWMVNESYRLRLEDVGKILSKSSKDSLCFRYEQTFRTKLPKEYGTSLRERMRKFFDYIMNDPYERYEGQDESIN